jgi:LSD1 subclass zinc finger protein
VKLRIPQDVLDAHGEVRRLLFHLTDMFSLYPGDRDVLVYLPGRKPVRCSSESRITPAPELVSRLESLLGKENIKY